MKLGLSETENPIRTEKSCSHPSSGSDGKVCRWTDHPPSGLGVKKLARPIQRCSQTGLKQLSKDDVPILVWHFEIVGNSGRWTVCLVCRLMQMGFGWCPHAGTGFITKAQAVTECSSPSAGLCGWDLDSIPIRRWDLSLKLRAEYDSVRESKSSIWVGRTH